MVQNTYDEIYALLQGRHRPQIQRPPSDEEVRDWAAAGHLWSGDQFGELGFKDTAALDQWLDVHDLKIQAKALRDFGKTVRTYSSQRWSSEEAIRWAETLDPDVDDTSTLDHSPSDADIRQRANSHDGVPNDVFDRWLESHDAAIRESALVEALKAVLVNAGYDEETGAADGVSVWPPSRRKAYYVAISESVEAIRDLRHSNKDRR